MMISPDARSPLEPVILVVEDDNLLRRASVRILMAAGYKVLEAASTAEAIALLEDNPSVAVLFTDIIMPGMNGFKLADLALRRWPGLRVLFTTTREKLRDVDDQPGLLPGIILLKPYDSRELETAIDTTLLRAAPSVPASTVG
jgi:two-component system, response regulator PdtaR